MKYQPGLRWNPDTIARLTAENGIGRRSELAKRLRPLGVSYCTVYRAFTEDWQGMASQTMLWAMATSFATPVHELISEPKEER